MPDFLADYFDALDRLKSGASINVPKGTRITKDSVSLEAGRKKGTIKKSRPIFKDLIDAIGVAAQVHSESGNDMQLRIKEAKVEAARYRSLWEEALAREVSLFKQLSDEREAWTRERAAMSGKKIVPIRNSPYI